VYQFQGDPLGLLLFSLVILQFIDAVKLRDFVQLNLQHLDDGTLVGKLSSLLLVSLLSLFSTRGPEFGLHLNLFKCKLLWPSGNSFSEIPSDTRQFTGLELLGSPLWGDDKFFKDFLSSHLDMVALTQDKYAMLGDPQVELHILRSCLSNCKIIHLFCTVPFSILKPFLYQLDLNLSLVLIVSCIVVFLILHGVKPLYSFALGA